MSFEIGDYSQFEPFEAIEELARKLECSQRGFDITSQNFEDDATGVLAPLNAELLRNYLPSSHTIWTNGSFATSPGSTVLDTFAKMVRRVGNAKIPCKQATEITSTLHSFLGNSHPRHSYCPVELTVSDFSYSTEGPIEAIFSGVDSFNAGTRSAPVFLDRQDAVSLRCSHYADSQRVPFDLSKWRIAKDQTKSRLAIRDSRRVTRLGTTMNLRSFEERLQLEDLDEIEVLAVPLRVYGYSSIKPIQIGAKDIRIRCVRYLPARLPNKIPKCDLHRLELVLIPGEYELLQAVTRFSSLRCYTVMTPGVAESINSAVEVLG